MRFALATAFALVAAVSAQSLSDLPACASNCSVASIPGSVCGTVTNVTCVCTNKPFQDVADACITANCTAEEKQKAIAFRDVVCASVTGSTTGGASSTGAPSPSTTTKPPGDSAVRLGAGLAAVLAVAGLVIAL